MSRRFRWIGLSSAIALLACAAALLVQGCGGKKDKDQAFGQYSEDLKEVVSAQVQDEKRRAQMLVIVDELQTVYRQFSQDTADLVASYRKLNANYDAPRNAFNRLFADYGAKRVRARDEVLELHFQLAALATAEEWDRIAKAEIKLYDKVGAARATQVSQ
jgi:hypothetical protein